MNKNEIRRLRESYSVWVVEQKPNVVVDFGFDYGRSGRYAEPIKAFFDCLYHGNNSSIQRKLAVQRPIAIGFQSSSAPQAVYSVVARLNAWTRRLIDDDGSEVWAKMVGGGYLEMCDCPPLEDVIFAMKSGWSDKSVENALVIYPTGNRQMIRKLLYKKPSTPLAE